MPWRLEAKGAPALVVGAYDRERAQHCWFLPDREGTWRCLPERPSDLRWTRSFSDPECRQPIYEFFDRTSAAPAPGEWMTVELPSQGCASQRYAVQSFEPMQLGAPEYVDYYGNGCTLLSTNTAPNYLVVTADSEPEDWALATPVDEGSVLVGRLRRQQLSHADGGVFDVGVWDTHWNANCFLRNDATQSECAIPTTDPISPYFGDDACTLQIWPIACNGTLAIKDSDDNYWAFGERWSGPAFTSVKGCREVGSFDPQAGYAFMGEPLAAGEAVQPLTWELAGSGRLRAHGLRGDAGFEMIGDHQAPGARYFDSELGLDCDPIWTPEGLVRCLPSNITRYPMSGQGYYSDPECTLPAFMKTSLQSDSILAQVQPDAHGRDRAVALRRAVAIPTYFTMQESHDGTPATCQGSTANGYWIEPGAELPWDGYATLEEINGVP